MKQKQLLRTLLAAVCLLVGTSAWADVTPVSQDYSSGTADWTSGNTGRYTVDMNAGGYLTVNAVGNGNNGATITGSTVNGKAGSGDDFESSDDFTMIFDLQLNGGNNQPSFFHINDKANVGGNEAETGHMLTLYQTSANSTTWQINGDEQKTVVINKNTWYTFQLSKKGSFLYLKVTPTAGGDPAFAQQQITVTSEKGGLGNMIFQTKRYYAYMAIDNVVLRAWQSGDTPDGVAATYTINYNFNSETIKSVSSTNLVGNTINAENPITISDVKYYATDASPKSMNLVDGTNVLNVELRKAKTWSYTVKTSTDVTLKSGTGTEGNQYTVGYPEYYLTGTDLYEINKYDDNSKQYTATFTLDSDNKNVSITAAKKRGNVVFYKEGEDIEGVTVNTTGSNVGIRASNAAAASIPAGGVTVCSLPAGTYKIYLGAHHTSNNATVTTAFTCGTNNISISTTGTNQVSKTSDEFSIAEATDLVCNSITGNGLLDYVYVIDVIAEAIADCKAFETSNAFATAIDAESFANAEAVYAFHTDWQIAQAEAASSNDITKVIRNAAITSTTDWVDSRVIELSTEKYDGAPDNFLIDANNQEMNTYQMLYGLPAGKYIIEAATRANAEVTSGKIYVYADGQVDKNAEGNHIGNQNGDLGHGWSWTSIDFELTSTSDVKIGYYVNATGSGKWASCDDWHLYKLPESVSATIGAAGWATLYSPYTLDFAKATPSGLKAYTATTDGAKVTLTPVDNVPAHTGVVLEGTAGNYSIPVIASSETGRGDLKGNATAATAFNAFGNYTLYILTLIDNNNVQFNPCTSGEIAAGKAFLKVAKTTGAKALSVMFANDPTGIANVNAAEVAQPAKRIVNGQLVIEKNGKRYNAAGAEF